MSLNQGFVQGFAQGFATKSIRVALATALVGGASTAFAAPIKYDIDSAHSRVGFSVRHMMISEVQGSFKTFEGKFTFDAEKGTVSDADFSADTKSINTENEKRDEHLRSADFFDAEKNPKITFKNSKLKKVSKDKYKWSGDLTMHGVTKPVTFDLEFRGVAKDPYGMMRAGFVATGKINRKDFGLTWNKALETGGVAVSEEVALKIDAEGVQAKADAPAAPAASPAKT
jgi:polyisoprenoid-binding protein YceI